MKMKTKKKPTEQQLKEKKRKSCVKLAKDIAKTKAGYKCEYDGCYRTKEGGYQMHGSHIHGENSNKSMSAATKRGSVVCPVVQSQ